MTDPAWQLSLNAHAFKLAGGLWQAVVLLLLKVHIADAMDHKWNLKPQQLLHAGRPAPPRLSLKVQLAGYALAMLAVLWTGSHRFAQPAPPPIAASASGAPSGGLFAVSAVP